VSTQDKSVKHQKLDVEQTAASLVVKTSSGSSTSTSAEQAAVIEKAIAETNEAVATAMGVASVPVDSSVKLTGEEKKETPTKQLLRCHSCRTKLPLTAIKCRCGHKFCPKHRYSDQHDCTFDYKDLGKRELIEKNPKVVAAKIQTL